LVNITIAGMGPIGVSIGLTLKKRNLSDIEIIGTSRNRESISYALKIGAIDKAEGNLKTATRKSQLVILDTPISETQEIMETLGSILTDGCVVTDTGNAKVSSINWATQHFLPGINFVGGHPLIKKRMQTIEEADSTVFDGIDYCIIPSESASEQSVKAVVNIVNLLGAKPFFLDPHEHDSYAAAMNYLPIILSSAFVTATSKCNSWREMHRLAASEFGEFSYLATNHPDDNSAMCIANTDSLLHWIDQIIRELHTYRNNIKENNDGLLDSFIEAWIARSRWENNTVIRNQATEMPSSGETMASAFVGKHLIKRYRQMMGIDKKQKPESPPTKKLRP
jgi:prephenate dehydrogenase